MSSLHSKRFAAKMDRMGLSQADFARLTGRSRMTVYRWRKDQTKPPEYAWTILANLEKIRGLSLHLAQATCSECGGMLQ